jgi:triosephosphate isomerase
MKRRPLIAGNWKMHTTQTQARDLAKAVAAASRDVADRDVMIAPPFTALAAVAEAISGSAVLLGSQNVCWEEKGAFTAEISPVMLKELGCNLAIVGHSERRHVFGESNAIVNRRVLGALKFGMTPILCVGETLTEREANRTLPILEQQVSEGLKDLSLEKARQIIVAYEPVWAIGTGKTATVEQAQTAHAFIRELLSRIFEKDIASQIRILYGGSVNSGNVDALMHEPDIDGALVGGAALTIDSFDRIIHFRNA